MAVFVRASESALRVVIATVRRLPVPLHRLLLVSQQAQVAEFVGFAESPLRVDIANLRRLLELHERHLDVDLGS